MHIFLLCPMHATFPANFILLYLMNLIHYLARNTNYESPHYAGLLQLSVTSSLALSLSLSLSLSQVQILPSPSFSQTSNTYFVTETNKCTLAKIFNYTVLFITPTCFGHSCDHLQGVVHLVSVRKEVYINAPYETYKANPTLFPSYKKPSITRIQNSRQN
jgi:hypothetical protein